MKANAGLSISSTRGLVPGYAGAALVILGFLVLGGCGAFQNQHVGGGPNVLRYNLQTEIPDLNSATTADVASFAVLKNVMEGLYRLDENDEPRPAMAKSVEVSEDELIYTFTLRDGIKVVQRRPRDLARLPLCLAGAARPPDLPPFTPPRRRTRRDPGMPGLQDGYNGGSWMQALRRTFSL